MKLRLFCILACAEMTLPSMSPAMAQNASYIPPAIQGLKSGTRKGPWILTETTMTALLKSRYEIVSTEAVVTISGGVTVGVNVAIAHGDLNSGASETARDAYFLKRGSNLYRCDDSDYKGDSVVCWHFEPTPAVIDTFKQIDLPENPLLGSWVAQTLTSRSEGSDPSAQ